MEDFEPQPNIVPIPLQGGESNLTPAPNGTVVKSGNFGSRNFKTGISGWNITGEGDAEFNSGTFRGTFNIGGTTITIDNTEDIQEKLDEINNAGGGTLYLESGTYTLTAVGITMYAGVALVGTSPTGTVIDFNNTAGEINIAGTHRYSTGTITSITNGVTVVGSGTSWVANVVAGRDSFFINGQWMTIAVVTDDTHITLSEGYDGSTIVAGTAYRISTPIQTVILSGFNVKNSTGSGIDIDDVRFLSIENVWSQDNNIGIDANYVAEWSMNNILPLSNTSHGITVTNGGRFSWNSVNSVSNGGSGIVYNSVRSAGFSEGVSNSNTADGFNITSCTDISLRTFDASSNGGQGIECVSGNSSLTFFDAGMRGNTSDGLKLTATTDNCLILGGSYENNGGYGINIAASTCDTNIINSPQYAGNSSGTLNNSGTGTVIIVDDTAYASSWNGNLGAPTKNAVYDKIELLAPLASPTFTGLVTTPAIKITTGAGASKILTSDADGDATWETPAGADKVIAAYPGTGLLDTATVISFPDAAASVNFADAATSSWQATFKVPVGATSISSITVIYYNDTISANIYGNFVTSHVGDVSGDAFEQDSTGTNTAFASPSATAKTGIITAPADSFNALTAIGANDLIGVKFTRVGADANDTYNTALRVQAFFVTFA